MAAQPLGGADPQQARAIAPHRIDLVTEQTGAHCVVMAHPPGVPVGRVDDHNALTKGAQPDLAGAGLRNGYHPVAAQRRDFTAVLFHGFGHARGSIDDKRAVGIGTHPDASGTVLKQGTHHGRRTIGRGQRNGDKSGTSSV